ncbi:MAG: serine hydrolase [Eubacteriales bacterium]|nr:serine hydrolase [Eubacteriales bacterium]
MRCTDDNQTTNSEIRRRSARKQQQTISILVLILLLCVLALAGLLLYKYVFRSHEIELRNPYEISDASVGVWDEVKVNGRAVPFTDGLCVTAGDVAAEGVALDYAEAGALMDLSDTEVLFAKNVHEQLYPASLTKIMTALVALKYGNLEDTILIDDVALDIDPDSSVCYLQYGDEYTLRQLIYGLLIASGNDAGNAIAYHVGGSIENFVEMMNQEAYEIGATNTHFSNAHGLQDENHYTTPYDIYLIFQEALKYDVFTDAISKQSYIVTYTDAEGEQYERTWTATSYYFTGEATAPADVYVFGGKTGTTDEAGACLALLTKDPYGNSYFSIIMKSDTKEDLYDEMNELLSIINKK